MLRAFSSKTACAAASFCIVTAATRLRWCAALRGTAFAKASRASAGYAQHPALFYYNSPARTPRRATTGAVNRSAPVAINQEAIMTHTSTICRSLAAGLLAISALAIADIEPAAAADLAYKAPAPATPTLDIHGWFDMTFSNDYSTSRGLLVTNTGLTSQATGGISFDAYKNPNGIINKISVYTGVWTDNWSEQNHPSVGSFNEIDWFVGTKTTFLKNWTATFEYGEFQSPPGAFSTERNINFTIGYDDSSWGNLIAIKPWVKFWYEVDGTSNTVVGVNGGTSDSWYVEFGMAPTLDLKKYTGVNVVLTAPTWVSVGPSSYWNRGITGCGLATTTCATSNAGVFSTGLTATAPISFIPANYGQWYVKGGFQYYNMLNDSLRLAQTFTGTASNFADSHKDYVLGFAGFGFAF
jgi:hypothetical protein